MSIDPAIQSTTTQQPNTRILLSGPFGTGRVAGDLLLEGFLQLFRAHEYFRDYEPAAISDNPEQTAKNFDITTIPNDLESIAQALAGGSVMLSIGETFTDADQQKTGKTTGSLKRLLAGIIAGRPTGVIGAGIEPPAMTGIAAFFAEIMARVDMFTVRDQASAIAAARSGLTAPAPTTANPTFGLPLSSNQRPATGRLGLDVCGLTNVDDRISAELISAMNHLTAQTGLHPVLFAEEQTINDQSIIHLRQSIDGAEVVPLTGPPTAMLDALGTVDLLLGTQYHTIVGAASRAVPAVALCFDPAVHGLAPQLRLGNYALSPDRFQAPQIVRAALQLWNNRARVVPALAMAYATRAKLAGENLEHVKHMLSVTPDVRIAECDLNEFAADSRTHVGEVLEVTNKFLSASRRHAAADVPATARETIEHKPLPADPLVTIYICAYNAAPWIEQALSSAINQTYRHLEILVVDDGSTDDTVARVQACDDPRISLHQIKHGGIARARTYAKEHFRGDLIVCLDADDWLAPELIAKEVALLQEHPEIDVTYCDRYLVDEHGTPTGEVWNYTDYPEPRRLLGDMFTGGRGRIPNGSMMERAEVARAVGAYNSELATTEDFDYAARLAIVARSFRGISEPLYFYRSFMSGASGKWDERNEVVTRVWREMWERHGGEYLLGEEPGRGLAGKQKEAAYLCRAGDIACRHGEAYIVSGASRHFFACACEFYVKALALEPYNYTAGSQVMKLAAAGHLNLKSETGAGTNKHSPQLDTFYANQPLLDVLYEHAIPELLARGRETITITVWQAGTGCEAYTIIIEALRRGVPPEKLRMRAYDSRPEKIEQARAGVYTDSELFNRGRSHFSQTLADRYFEKQADGRYRVREEVARQVTWHKGDITKSDGIDPAEKSDIVFASSLWEAIDTPTAGTALANLTANVHADGYLFLGGFYPSRNAALAELRKLEPVRERFEDIHDGWRYRRGAYGSRPYGLEPLDRRYQEWPWRYGCAFRLREVKQLDYKAPNLLKEYWTERGRVYKWQYPALPLKDLPVPQRMVEMLQDEQPGSVLDYGCGFGTILREVRAVLPTAQLIGLDISRTVLFEGYKYMLDGTPVGLVESDGKTVPFPDNSFAATFTHVTLIHVPHEEIRGVLAEMVRVTHDTLYIGESAYKEHEQFYYFAHDYPALFAEINLVAEEIEITDAHKQPGTRLFRIDVRRKATRSQEAGRGQTSFAVSPAAVSPRRRLLIVSDRRSVHTRRFCRFFREQGHDVQLFDGGTDWEGLEGIVQHAPDPVRFPEGDADRQLYSRVARLREIITAMKPDWVHGHYLIGWGWWAALAAGDTPLALTAWGSDVFMLPEEQSHTRNMTRWALQLADRVTADSTALAQAAEQLAGDGRQVMLVPFGVDTEAFRPGADPTALRRRLMIPDDARVILSPRQIKPGTNIQFIIDAFQQIAAGEPRALLLLKTYLTTFEKQSAFMNLIRTKLTETDLWGRVRIVHDLPPEQIPALYALAEVTISVRDTDGTPCTLFESCATGTPVIAGDIPSLSEWITHEENGLLVPTRNADAIAQAIRQVFAGGPEIEHIKSTVRDFALSHGDYRRCFSRIEELYCAPAPGKHARCRTTTMQTLAEMRGQMCAAIDRGEFDKGFEIFQTINRLVAGADFGAAIEYRTEEMLQPA
jgi:chemotaxis methyl-accepting protein methylase/glycosyltransferase involved in cell wall biosynthesis/polysaccharide pyruvyl transferase WcaK-like protein